MLQWLVEAAEQLRAFSAYFLCDLHLEQLQLDELYAVLRPQSRRDQRRRGDEASGALTLLGVDGHGPQSKLLVVVDVGSRTLAMAQRVVHQVPGCWRRAVCRCF